MALMAITKPRKYNIDKVRWSSREWNA